MLQIAFINGEFIDVQTPVVPIEERGHQFGDGVYDVAHTYKGKPFLMREHWERLKRSCEAIRIEMPYTIEEIEAFALEGMKRGGFTDEANIYVQITRGASPRNHLFPDVPPIVTMTITEANRKSEKNWEEGVSVGLLPDERWANCYIKSLNLLPNVLAKQTAVENGHFEAVLIRDGIVTEGSSANAWCIKDGVVYTHPANNHILNGITRVAVLGVAAELGIEVREEAVTPDFFVNADEAFLTSTTVEVMPIVSVDGKSIGNGKPGELTLKLLAAFRKLYQVEETVQG